MIKAVLLDMEDTLLQGVNCSVGESIQQSIESVSRSNPSTAEMASAYAAALNQLASHRDMMTCNAEVLSGSIAESLHMSHEETEDRLDLFFAFLNDTIRKYVFADPCSVPLVSALLEQNLAVALAVQPIYPETSILEWLDWTGLSPYKDDLEFIACSRDLHFVKPDPAFYAEIVARIGVEPDETLLIGNFRSNVSATAKAAGLHTWQICKSAPLAAFFEHIHLDSWQEEYAPLPLAAETLEPQYRGNVAALFGLIAEVKKHQWLQKPDPDEWSILQILCHLADAEVAVHQQRLKLILTEEGPFLGSPSPPGPDLPPCHDDGYAVLHQFRKARLETMELLAGLRAEDWRRPARHSIFGLTNLREMAYFTAQHDRLHITQLCQTLGKCTDTM